MKKIAFIFLISLMIGCDQSTKKSNNRQANDGLPMKNHSEKAIATLKEFYFSVYGNDENNDGLKKKYLSERVLKIIDSLTSDSQNLSLDYDPFINGQDYDGQTIKKLYKLNR